MAKCKKCGAAKRRWPRSCSRCGAGSGRADAADLAVASGLFGWIWRGITGAVRWVLRALG
ncbi:hypothetical protein [Streptomyces marincola]|uniref:hypothetical protein n=1 Tax=Streptomyces marincola TaxID=2878388 RepID=UPI001CF1D5BF|nr:hypothetical protein [Streptomyces marincola]UCM86938.1 hypothetical protein LC193_02735 [Streptomyces marincola]